MNRFTRSFLKEVPESCKCDLKKWEDVQGALTLKTGLFYITVMEDG